MDGAGTLSDRWALAAGRASSKGCRICHGPRLPGTRLCAPCKAALKRARQETISDLIPQPSRAAEEARAEALRRKQAAVAARPAPSSHRRWLLATFIVASAAAVVAVYVTLRPPPPQATPAVALPLSSPPRPAVPAHWSDPAADAREANRFLHAGMPRSTPTPAPVRAPVRPVQKRAVEPPAPSVAAVIEAPAAPEAPAPAPVPVASSVVKAAPPPDRWQVMSEAIARCGRDGFFAGVICEQRVRIQYCEGYWGQVAQCPSAINNDYGR